jgi:hypothetical protein
MSVYESVVRIETRVGQLDVSLFDAIPSQTSPYDRRSMLAIQAAAAERLGSFSYLEIGSHLGGSIQPLLLDPRCKQIVSIDKRPAAQPDERGESAAYPRNSTERMLENLRGIAGDAVGKITTFDVDSSELNSSMLGSKVNLCFVDGEHTNRAAESDYAFCESVLIDGGLIYFHDANIIFQALDSILERLRTVGKSFHAYNLPDVIFVIDFGLNIHQNEAVQSLLLENHRGYISGLQSMAHYRHFYNHWFSGLLRKVSTPLRTVLSRRRR